MAKLDAHGALVWNTFLGSAAEDYGYGIAVDSGGNVFVAGYGRGTWGSPLRAFEGPQAAFVAGLDPNGSLLWNTFLGGAGDDYALDLDLGAGGELAVTGASTVTWGSPVHAAAGSTEAFVARLDTSGTLVWHTFLGSASADDARGVAVGPGGNIYVAGSSDASWGMPVEPHSGSFDAFAAELDSTGALTWNTFFGGPGIEISQGLAVDAGGNVYVTGYSRETWGAPVRAYSGDSDAFAAMLDASGALAWNTFLGSTARDVGYGIGVDASGGVYVVGVSAETWGTPLNAFSGAGDGFAARLDASGALTGHTFLGGAGVDQAQDVAVDAGGTPYVTGISDASWGSPVRAYSASNDGFVTVAAAIAAPKVLEVPTLSQTMLVLFGLLLAAMAVRVLRRRSRAA